MLLSGRWAIGSAWGCARERAGACLLHSEEAIEAVDCAADADAGEVVVAGNEAALRAEEAARLRVRKGRGKLACGKRAATLVAVAVKAGAPVLDIVPVIATIGGVRGNGRSGGNTDSHRCSWVSVAVV